VLISVKKNSTNFLQKFVVPEVNSKLERPKILLHRVSGTRKLHHLAIVVICKWGTAVAQWLRYCATNRKVTDSIPDGVIGIFH
jgi:hypothetical protein